MTTVAQQQARIRELKEERKALTQTTAVTKAIPPGVANLAQAGSWSLGEAQLVMSVIAPGLKGNHQAFLAFARVCVHVGLDPFRREIYAWLDKGKLTCHIGIGGWRALAERTGQYNGQAGTLWCGEDGEWRDVWLSNKTPSAAKVGVFRKGNDIPTYAVATYREFYRNTPTWKDMPAHMLSVRAEYHALMRACPSVEAEVKAAIAETKDMGFTVEVTNEEPPHEAEAPIEGEATEEQPSLLADEA